MPSKMKRPWTMEQIELLRKLASDGRSATDISDIMGRSWESVRGAALRHGIRIDLV